MHSRPPPDRSRNRSGCCTAGAAAAAAPRRRGGKRFPRVGQETVLEKGRAPTVEAQSTNGQNAEILGNKGDYIIIRLFSSMYSGLIGTIF